MISPMPTGQYFQIKAAIFFMVSKIYGLTYLQKDSYPLTRLLKVSYSVTFFLCVRM